MNHQPILTGRALGYRAVQVLDCVRRYMAEEGRAPSYGMIASELGLRDRGDVSKIIDRLERRGLLRRTGAGRVRRIRLR